MTAFASLPIVDQEALAAIRNLLAKMIEEGIVDAVLVPVQNRDGWSAQHALIVDSEHMALANPLMPVMMINGARMATLVTARELAPSNDQPAARLPRIAAVLRPCELRAVVELAKLQQVNYDQLLTVSIDCVGTHELADLQAAGEDMNPSEVMNAVLDACRKASPDAPGDLPYRHACTICETPLGWNADISIHTIGVGDKEQLLIEVSDESLLEKLGLTAGADASGHTQAVEALRATRRERREAELDTFEAEMAASDDGLPGLIEAFQTCQRCHNCTVVCPICYCKECLFRTATMEYEPDRYFRWAKRKGVARLPGDTIAFQLTRLAHVSVSCVGCGVCTSGCPSHLPIDTLFQTVARRTQALIDYVPGHNIEDPLPRASYRQEEFVELGRSEH
jgi:formate dehydrogenase subunit beta